jgi:hypothetical protein
MRAGAVKDRRPPPPRAQPAAGLKKADDSPTEIGTRRALDENTAARKVPTPAVAPDRHAVEKARQRQVVKNDAEVAMCSLQGERAYDDIDAFGNPLPPSGFGATSKLGEKNAPPKDGDDGRPSLEERARRRQQAGERPATGRLEGDRREEAPR